MENWATRTERKRQELGWSKAELARRARIDPSLLRHYLSGQGVANPRDDGVYERLAVALDVDVMWLRHGQGPESLEVPVVGYTAAGESWLLFDGSEPDPHETVTLSLAGSEPFAIEVRGASNWPVYREGDRLLCARVAAGETERLYGKDCAVCTESGERLLKQVHRGKAPGTFRLRSYNPDYPDIDGVRLAWAAPVVWIRRG